MDYHKVQIQILEEKVLFMQRELAELRFQFQVYQKKMESVESTLSKFSVDQQVVFEVLESQSDLIATIADRVKKQ